MQEYYLMESCQKPQIPTLATERQRRKGFTGRKVSVSSACEPSAVSPHTEMYKAHPLHSLTKHKGVWSSRGQCRKESQFCIVAVMHHVPLSVHLEGGGGQTCQGLPNVDSWFISWGVWDP